jgi:hypothetical protein
MARTRETFFRGQELARSRRSMPARTYNLSRILLGRSPDAFVFVPIRSMQVLAIVEACEFNFVHREARREIELSWLDFAPGERSGLDEPVPFDAVFYAPEAAATMLRLQGEFLKALELMEARSVPSGTGAVLELKPR